MKGGVWIILVLLNGIKAERIVNGFEMLESLSEDLMAGENFVEAETPFSPELSICLWLNQKRLPHKNTHINLFDLRTNLTKRIKGRPMIKNFPTLNVYVRDNTVNIQDITFLLKIFLGNVFKVLQITPCWYSKLVSRDA